MLPCVRTNAYLCGKFVACSTSSSIIINCQFAGGSLSAFEIQVAGSAGPVRSKRWEGHGRLPTSVDCRCFAGIRVLEDHDQPRGNSPYFSLLRYREIGLAASKSFQRCRRVVDHPGDTHPAERAEAPVQMPDDTGEIAKPLSAETHVPIPYSLQFRTRMSANPSKFGYSDLVTATAPVRPETDA